MEISIVYLAQRGAYRVYQFLHHWYIGAFEVFTSRLSYPVGVLLYIPWAAIPILILYYGISLF